MKVNLHIKSHQKVSEFTYCLGDWHLELSGELLLEKAAKKTLYLKLMPDNPSLSENMKEQIWMRAALTFLSAQTKL